MNLNLIILKSLFQRASQKDNYRMNLWMSVWIFYVDKWSFKNNNRKNIEAISSSLGFCRPIFNSRETENQFS